MSKESKEKIIGWEKDMDFAVWGFAAVLMVGGIAIIALGISIQFY